MREFKAMAGLPTEAVYRRMWWYNDRLVRGEAISQDSTDQPRCSSVTSEKGRAMGEKNFNFLSQHSLSLSFVLISRQTSNSKFVTRVGIRTSCNATMTNVDVRAWRRN